MAKIKSAIWITGASSGIGKETAKEFARTGGKVFVSARRVSELERLNDELESEKLSVNIYPCNVASSTNVDQTVKKIYAEGSKIDCLVNNAGITSFKAAENNSVQEINDIINTHLLGSIYAIRYILPHMIEQGGGTIINILSLLQIYLPRSSAYPASKMGCSAIQMSARKGRKPYLE